MQLKLKYRVTPRRRPLLKFNDDMPSEHGPLELVSDGKKCPSVFPSANPSIHQKRRAVVYLILRVWQHAWDSNLMRAHESPYRFVVRK